MNKMKQLIIGLVALIIAASIVAVVINFTKWDLKNSPQSSSSEPGDKSEASHTEIKQKVLFMLLYTSPENKYSRTGYLVDKNGMGHYFDISGDYDAKPAKLYKYALEQYDKEEPIEFVSQSSLELSYRLMQDINPETGFTAYEDTSVFTTETLYAIIGEGKSPSIIKVYKTGAECEDPKDPNSQSIRSVFTDSAAKVSEKLKNSASDNEESSKEESSKGEDSSAESRSEEPSQNQITRSDISVSPN